MLFPNNDLSLDLRRMQPGHVVPLETQQANLTQLPGLEFRIYSGSRRYTEEPSLALLPCAVGRGRRQITPLLGSSERYGLGTTTINDLPRGFSRAS